MFRLFVRQEKNGEEKIAMKRVKMIVAYDGTNYCGWQVQPNGLAVQEVVNRCLRELLKEEISVIGASRTDAGVHALGNVCVFDTRSRMPAEKISLALNTYLPWDIRIQDSCQVPEDFHPRFQNTIKTYEYRILNRKYPDPTKRLYTYFCYYPLDVEKMRQGAAYLVGEHDFRSFSTAKPGVDNTVRTIYSLEVSRSPEDVITLRITGNGFLYNMVRIIAGTLLRVGGGAIPPEQIKEILEGKDRSLAGETARPEGLTLVEIRYPDWERACHEKKKKDQTAEENTACAGNVQEEPDAEGGRGHLPEEQKKSVVESGKTARNREKTVDTHGCV